MAQGMARALRRDETPRAAGLSRVRHEDSNCLSGGPGCELNRHVASAVAKDTPRGWRLDKAGARDQIDAVVSLAMAVERAEAKPRVERGWDDVEGELAVTATRSSSAPLPPFRSNRARFGGER